MLAALIDMLEVWGPFLGVLIAVVIVLAVPSFRRAIFKSHQAGQEAGRKFGERFGPADPRSPHAGHPPLGMRSRMQETASAFSPKLGAMFANIPPRRMLMGAFAGLSVCTFFGVVALGLIVWYEASHTNFINASIETKGVVISVEHVGSRNSNRTTYRPTFRFTDEGGAEHTATPRNGTAFWSFDEGEEIRVRYRPGQQQEAQPAGYEYKLLGFRQLSFMLTAFGGVFLIIGVGGAIWVWMKYGHYWAAAGAAPEPGAAPEQESAPGPRSRGYR